MYVKQKRHTYPIQSEEFKMKEFSFEVTKTGWIHVEADSVEDAEARLQENFGHYYVITETGEELSVGWELTGEVEEDPE